MASLVVSERGGSGEYCLVIHGGAGVISPDIDPTPYYRALEVILRSVHSFIQQNREQKNAVDICEYAVSLLEDEPLFNAGIGAVLTNRGSHELEASIMDGSNLKCGAVSMITKIKNPIRAARLVMDTTCHNYIIGEAAEAIASGKLEFVDNSYFTTEKRRAQLLKAQEAEIVALDHDIHKSEPTFSPPSSTSDSAMQRPSTDSGGDKQKEGSKFGTVGAVCMYRGSVAAATSTGGMTNKMSGRIGDTPIIGAGTYASNDSCAISATGWGEEFMRRCAAYDIAARMKYANQSLEDACHAAVFGYLPDQSGGIIAVDRNGSFSMDHNSPGMFRGVMRDDGSKEGSIGIWKELKIVNLEV